MIKHILLLNLQFSQVTRSVIENEYVIIYLQSVFKKLNINNKTFYCDIFLFKNIYMK